MGRLRAALWLMVALACPARAAPPIQAVIAAPPPPLPEVARDADPPAVVRTVPNIDSRVTIPIQIDGQGPWNFIVDTGSQRTVIARDLAQELQLPVRERVTVVSMTNRADVHTVAVPRLRFGKSVVEEIEAPVLEGAHIGAAGLLGLDWLHAKRLMLNFPTGRMEITSSKAAWRDPNAVIVEARRRNGQLLLLDSEVNGAKLVIILDTGTSISVGNRALLNRLARRKKAPSMQAVTLESVTGETLAGQMGVVDQVRMGSVVLKDMPVMFADAPPFAELDLQDKPALLLGISALRLFDRVAIDFGRGNVDFLLPDTGFLNSARFADARRNGG